MLREGFHKSFRELDVILLLQIEERYRLGSEHPVWDRPLLDQEPRKLDYLCKKLTLAERSELTGMLATTSFPSFLPSVLRVKPIVASR